MKLTQLINYGKRPRSLGQFKEIAAGQVRYFEGQDAEALDYILGSPAVKPILNIPGGIRVKKDAEAVEDAIAAVRADLTRFKTLEIGAGVAVVESLEADKDLAFLKKLVPYALKLQVSEFLETAILNLEAEQVN